MPFEIFSTGLYPGRKGEFALGCNVLLPFSNRISSGGFVHDGRFHALEPNLPNSPYPTHGNAFQRAWKIAELSVDRVVLQLESSGPGPFRYAAGLTYSLANGALVMELAARNTAHIGLPFGIGFHPWFVRVPLTRLTMKAAGHWRETGDHLPSTFHRINEAPDFDFSTGAELPKGWINTAFTGWDGTARIDWLTRELSVGITADPPLSTAIIYSPSAAADFICFEPVSHSVDAYNRSEPGTAPPQVLAPGESLVARMKISPFVNGVS